MKYRKKPVIIEAIHFNGSNYNEIKLFSVGKFYINNAYEFVVDTLEGQMKADVGDYIIKGVNGEFYPCNPDIFKKTYEEIK